MRTPAKRLVLLWVLASSLVLIWKAADIIGAIAVLMK